MEAYEQIQTQEKIVLNNFIRHNVIKILPKCIYDIIIFEYDNINQIDWSILSEYKCLDDEFIMQKFSVVFQEINSAKINKNLLKELHMLERNLCLKVIKNM